MEHALPEEASLPKRKLNNAEAASFLNVSESYLNRLRVRGGGPKFSKIGSRVLYDLTELQAWFEARSRSSTSDVGRAA